jgi:aquaporin Z
MRESARGSSPGAATALRWQPALRGVHVVEWGCELIGTALLLFAGLSAVVVDLGHGGLAAVVASVVPSPSLRLLVSGLLFAGAGSLIAVSPLGRRSGAHLNPSVTFGFWLTGHVDRSDLAGYVVAQCAGATLGAWLVVALWGRVAVRIFDVRTVPGRGVGDVEAAFVEAAITATLLLTIFFFTARPRLARWTPVAVWILIALLVWRTAPLTGTSLNPARTLGPDLVGRSFTSLWVYLVGPPAGAAAAALVAHLARSRLYPLTAKLHHHPAYRSVFKSGLPVARRRRAP